MYPENLRYTKSHEWIRVDGNTGIIGISGFAVEQVKDIVFVELPKVGMEVKAESAFGSLESVKAVFELLSPVSGKVIAINENINKQPDIVSKNPYEDGWFVRIEINDLNELSKLMTAEDYRKYVETEGAGH